MTDDRIETAEALAEAATRFKPLTEMPQAITVAFRDAFVQGAVWQASRPDAPADGLVEIGGQTMTEAQFDAARFPLLHPAPGVVQP